MLVAAFVDVVIGITDGDTMTVLHGKQQVKVRLSEIDAPEKAQPFGKRSKQSLSEICHTMYADIDPVSRDRYGRTVARVSCGGVDANAEQVRRGMAWVYDRYAHDKTLYRIQDEARSSGIGLWSSAHPVPPWEWRKGRRRKHR